MSDPDMFRLIVMIYNPAVLNVVTSLVGYVSELIEFSRRSALLLWLLMTLVAQCEVDQFK